MNQFWLASIADWLLNLSAGWFAAAIVVPTLSERSVRINWWLLTVNLLLAILSLLFAIHIREILGVL